MLTGFGAEFVDGHLNSIPVELLGDAGESEREGCDVLRPSLAVTVVL